MMIMERLDPSVEHWDDKKGSAGMTRKGGTYMTPFLLQYLQINHVSK
ncbi:hypothetical protein GO685_01045 [Wolbachia endosymbiont of Madathamugadia hiepei]|nr:hypothetical protein [Wolbachia endosymbiont of Madathamugadia hiepei]NUX01111.1 hypothetical protein [Wolbachia endosymbiont of Madathamugadia hiepei]